VRRILRKARRQLVVAVRERTVDVIILALFLGALLFIDIRSQQRDREQIEAQARQARQQVRALQRERDERLRLLLRVCDRVEQVTGYIRTSNRFNLRTTKRVLRDLGIDPASPAGQRLIDAGRVNSQRLVRRFKAKPCRAR
jgi:hypothetical protein